MEMSALLSALRLPFYSGKAPSDFVHSIGQRTEPLMLYGVAMRGKDSEGG